MVSSNSTLENLFCQSGRDVFHHDGHLALELTSSHIPNLLMLINHLIDLCCLIKTSHQVSVPVDCCQHHFLGGKKIGVIRFLNAVVVTSH